MTTPNNLIKNSIRYCKLHGSAVRGSDSSMLCEYVLMLDLDYHKPSACRPVNALVVWYEDDENVASGVVGKRIDEERDHDIDHDIDVLARWSVRGAVEAWQEEGWGNQLPDVGEYDYERICVRMCELLPPEVSSIEQFSAAYEALAALAEGTEDDEG